MKKLLVSLVGGLLMLSAVSARSFAAMDGPGPGGKSCHEEGMPMMPPFLPMGGPGFMPFPVRHFAGLALTEKQKDAIKEIEITRAKDSIRKTAEIEIAEVELKEILDKDSADLTALEAKLKKIESLRTELRFAHVKAIEEMKSKLTADQKKKLREILEAGPGFPPESKERPLMH